MAYLSGISSKSVDVTHHKNTNCIRPNWLNISDI